MTGESMKAAVLTSFNPEEVKIITDAYALAVTTFESNERSQKSTRTSGERDHSPRRRRMLGNGTPCYPSNCARLLTSEPAAKPVV
jgi:hypothetical protein